MVDVVFDNMHNSTVVYASEYTQSQLGWITAEVNDIANADMLIITREDLLPDFSGGFGNFVSTQDKLTEILETAGIADRVHPINFNSIANSALSNQATALSLDFNNDNQTDFGIIITPDLDATPESYVSLLSGVPESMLANVPGDAEDYIASIMMHEAGHIRQNSVMFDSGVPYDYLTNPLLFEADADATMVQAFRQAHDEGLPVDPAVLEIFEIGRAAGGLRNTGVVAGTEMAENLVANSAQIRMTSHNTANMVDWDNGLPKTTSQAELAQVEAEATMQVNYLLGMVDFAEKLQDSIDAAPSDEAAAAIEQASMNTASNYQSQISSVVSQGSIYAQQNPGAAFAALEVMYEKGYIDEAEPYVEQVRNFFEQHAPDIFGTEGYKDVREQLENIPTKSDYLATSEYAPETSISPTARPENLGNSNAADEPIRPQARQDDFGLG